MTDTPTPFAEQFVVRTLGKLQADRLVKHLGQRRPMVTVPGHGCIKWETYPHVSEKHLVSFTAILSGPHIPEKHLYVHERYRGGRSTFPEGALPQLPWILLALLIDPELQGGGTLYYDDDDDEKPTSRCLSLSEDWFK